MLEPSPVKAPKSNADLLRKRGRHRSLRSAVAFGAGLLIGSVGVGHADGDSPFENLGVFAHVLTHIENSYVEEVDQDALIQGAIRGMTETLDPHSTYLDPEEFQMLMSDTAGRFAGIGVEIGVRDGWLTVMSVFEDGPAAAAGLQAGDRFLHIEGRAARDMRISESIRLVRGEPGTELHVGIRREGEEEDLQITLRRAYIEVDAVETTRFEDGLLYVRIRAFQETTSEDLRSAIDAAVEAGGVRGILLDLRNNPGGLLREAIAVSDAFLEDGMIVATRGRGGQELQRANARSRGTYPAEWPIVVLVNGYSASAAEIVAAALQDHQRATIAGVRTFGKGSVQNIIQLEDGGAMKLTIARYYTASGRSVQARGVEPDLHIEPFSEDAVRAARAATQAGFRESNLEGHLDAAQRRGEESPTGRDEVRLDGTTPAIDARFPDDLQARVAAEALEALMRQPVR